MKNLKKGGENMHKYNRTLRDYLRGKGIETIMDYVGPMALTLLLMSLCEADTIEVYVSGVLTSIAYSTIRLFINYKRSMK